MKSLIAISLAFLTPLAVGESLKPLADAFVSVPSKAAPALRLLQGNPPVAVEHKPFGPALVHFWATWCAPCVEELPALVKSAEAMRKSGFELVLVSIDVGAASKVPPFLSKLGIGGARVFWDPRSELYKKFAISMLPTTVALAANGQEFGRVTGAARWSGESDAIFLASKVPR